MCLIHGLTAALECSPDVHPCAEDARQTHQIVDLVYTIEGQAVWAYYVSPGFALTHELKAGVYHDEDPGVWRKELVGACAKCFANAHRGYLDESHRWNQSPAVRD
jgi:hypothetical protein